MKTLIKNLAIVLLSISTTSFAFAQCCGGGGSFNSYPNSSCSKKNATAPHNGTLQEAGKYKIEMVKDFLSKVDPIKFYLLDKKGNEITGKSISGTAIFKFDDNNTETLTLEQKNDGGLVAQLKNKTKSFTCTLTLIIDKKNITVVFAS